MAIESRSAGKADEFLQTLRGNLTNIQDMPFTVQTVSGVSVTVHDVAESEQSIAFCRSGRMVLIASNLDGIRQMLSAQKNQALAQAAVYQRLVTLRPRDWSASIFINQNQLRLVDLENLLPGLQSGLFTLITSLPAIDTLEGALVSASLVPAGLRLDTFTAFTPSSLPDANLEILQNLQPNPAVLKHIPDSAIVYTAGPRADLVYTSIFESGLITTEDQQNLEENFREQYGFDLQSDMIDRLNRDWVLYASPANDGFLPETADIPLAVSLIASTDAVQEILDTVDLFNGGLEENGLTVNQDELNGFTWYEAADNEGLPVFVYGIGSDLIFFGSERAALESGVTASALLMNQAGYRQLTASLPKDMAATIYIHLDGLYDILRENMSASEGDSFDAAIAPYQSIQELVFAISLPQPDILRSSLILGLPSR
jgi:hypothetical protein